MHLHTTDASATSQSPRRGPKIPQGLPKRSPRAPQGLARDPQGVHKGSPRNPNSPTHAPEGLTNLRKETCVRLGTLKKSILRIEPWPKYKLPKHVVQTTKHNKMN